MDSERKRHAEAVGRHFRRALLASMAFVALIGAIFFATPALGGLRAFALVPLEASGLVGILTAPLLHGSAGHWLANASALLVLGTLVGTVYPRAALRALPVLWLLSGLVTWLIGRPSFHIGASGLTHGLMFLVFVLGVVRRDRPSIAAAMIAFLLYGGMLLTVLPREAGVSWQSHLGGAVAGVVAALLWRHRDPLPPRKRYSWEEEEEAQAAGHDTLEPPSPTDVPVLWNRPEPRDEHGVVLEFPPRGRAR